MFIYDSLISSTPRQLKEQVAALLYENKSSITLKFVKVALQTNGSDCGIIYAIAFATALCLGQSPGLLQFDKSRMRSHLEKCLEQGKFTMFPYAKRTANTQSHLCAGCLLCLSHALPDTDMIECTSCKKWFHV